MRVIMNSLEKARNKLNEIDKKMAELFTMRMSAVKAIAEHKIEHGLQITDSSREAEVIARNSELVSDKVIREYYVNFIKNNISISKDYQRRLIEGMKIAYSGTEGAFAHIAAKKLFPSAAKIAYDNFECAYHAVENGSCDAVVLPIENSYNGEVGQVTDLMFSGSLYITDTIELPVSHDLLALPGASLSDIKRVISHPQALGQCASYIREKGFLQLEYANTALAAKEVSRSNDKTLAAIASEEAAEIFGLQVLERNINVARTNTTKFAVLSRAENRYETNSPNIHTSLMFAVRNEAGALAKAIEIIGKHGFNMRSLRSRPMKELLWQYYFYVEAEGNVNTEDGADMMLELRKCCDRLKSLGTYIKE